MTEKTQGKIDPPKNPALDIPPSLTKLKTQKGYCGECSRSARKDQKK